MPSPSERGELNIPWRPSNIKNFQGSEAVHVVNQLFRETNFRIDNLEGAQQPTIRGQATLNFGSVAGNTCVDRPVHILGVNQNHVPHVAPLTTVGSGLSWSAWVLATDKVNIRVCNASTGAVAANTIKWRVLAQ